MKNLEKDKIQFIERLTLAFNDEKKRRINTKERKLTKTLMGEAVGVTPQSVNRWFKTGTIESKRLPSLAYLLNVDLAWLEHGVKESSQRQKELINSKSINSKVPEISFIQAAEFTEGVDIYATGYALKWHPRVKAGANIYTLRVLGDSMTAPHGKSFSEGMLLHIDPDIKFPNNNSFVIAKVNGQVDITFKQFKQGESKPYLCPLNNRHEMIYDDFKVLGVVIFACWDDL